MRIKQLAIPDVKLLIPQRHEDNRGYLSEIINEHKFGELGLPQRFAQENQSLSLRKHTVRGMHAQSPPHAQAKLVRVLRGAIMDVAVDARPNSKTYGQHVGEVLTADDTQMLIPAGFLHGFCTMEDNTVVLYKLTDFYAPGKEIGAVWNDADLDIPWPIDAAQAILSDKDKALPRFKDLPHIAW